MTARHEVAEKLASNQSEAASHCDDRHEEPLAAQMDCRHPNESSSLVGRILESSASWIVVVGRIAIEDQPQAVITI